MYTCSMGPHPACSFPSREHVTEVIEFWEDFKLVITNPLFLIGQIHLNKRSGLSESLIPLHFLHTHESSHHIRLQLSVSVRLTVHESFPDIYSRFIFPTDAGFFVLPLFTHRAFFCSLGFKVSTVCLVLEQGTLSSAKYWFNPGIQEIVLT